MTRVALSILLAVACLSVLSCRRREQPAPQPVAQLSDEERDAERLKRLQKDVEEAAEAIPDEIVHIPDSGEDGWAPPAAEPKTVAMSTDERFALDKTLRCESQTIMKWYHEDGTEDTMQGVSPILIQDGDTFRIEYYMPESGTTLHRVVANDGKFAYFDESGTRHVRPPRIEGKVSAEELDMLAETMSKDLIALWLPGGPGFNAVIEAYRNGVGGYKLTPESRNTEFDGEQRTQHRFVASTEQGIPTEVEIIIDGKFYRPVTMRVTRKLPDGVVLRKVWNGKWMSGGTHPADTFAIPPESKR